LTATDPRTDASFEWLRDAHRSERAPEELRRRLQERAGRTSGGSERARLRGKWRARGTWLALAAVVAGAVWLGVSRSTLDDTSRSPAALHDIVTPTREPSSRTGASAPACPPAPDWFRNQAEIDGSAKLYGFRAQSLEVESPGCGLLTRRYLIQVPEALAPHVPVLIVLHDAGESAEQAQITTRWWFNDLAQRIFAVLVYANGLSAARPVVGLRGYGGVWQTDADAHPLVDDVAYLDAIVGDLRRQGLAQREVFLLGQGSGGVMALAAALQHPEQYAGVAAFLPPRMPELGELAAAPPATGQFPLRSIFIALPRIPQENSSRLVVDWAARLGSAHGAIHVTRQKPDVQRIDSTLASGVRLRIVTLPEQVDPFPPPGGADGPARAASEKRPYFFDGPAAAWELFQSQASVPPFSQRGKP
jgi:predicted esterase